MEIPKLERVAALRKEFADVVKNSPDPNARYEHTKVKKSQSEDRVSNVTVIMDKGTSTKFIVSFNAEAICADPEHAAANEERLSKLQNLVTKFLKDLHNEL